VQGFGFWAGASHADICAHETGVPAAHWQEEQPGFDECELLVGRLFRSFLTGMCFALYAVLAWRVFESVMFHVTVVRPLAESLKPKR